MRTRVTIALAALVGALPMTAHCQDSDPAHRDQVNERLERLKAEEPPAIDYSTMNADELVWRAAGSIPRQAHTEKRIAAEIAQRPDEVKAAMLRLADSDEVSLEQLYHLPHWASYVSEDFQAELAKKILFSPSALNTDVFVVGPEFCGYFDGSAEIKKAVIEELLSQGRLEEGSKAHRWWQVSASERAKLHTGRAGEGSPSPPDEEGGDDDAKGGIGLFPVWIAVAALLGLLGAFLFLKRAN